MVIGSAGGISNSPSEAAATTPIAGTIPTRIPATGLTPAPTRTAAAQNNPCPAYDPNQPARDVIVEYKTGSSSALRAASAALPGAPPNTRLSPAAPDQIASEIARLQADPDVLCVTANYRRQILSIGAPIPHQKGRTSTDTQGGGGGPTPTPTAVPTFAPVPPDEYWQAAQKVNADQAQAAGIRGNARTVVGILDTGADYTHPQLAPRLLPGQNLAYPWDPTNAQEDHYHGTHVSGIFLSMCPDCMIMPFKVLDNNGYGYDYDISRAMRIAADFQVTDESMSLGGTAASPTMCAAAKYAIDRGVQIYAAAGNYGMDTPLYPAACPGVQAVSALYFSDEPVSWSNHGRTEGEIAFSAPGVSITSTCPLTWSTDGYCSLSGTSMATPVLSGSAALCSSTGFSATVCRDKLKGAADDVLQPLYGKRVNNGPIHGTKSRPTAVGLEGPTLVSAVGVTAPFSLKAQHADFVVLYFQTGSSFSGQTISKCQGSSDPDLWCANIVLKPNKTDFRRTDYGWAESYNSLGYIQTSLVYVEIQAQNEPSQVPTPGPTATPTPAPVGTPAAAPVWQGVQTVMHVEYDPTIGRNVVYYKLGPLDHALTGPVPTGYIAQYWDPNSSAALRSAKSVKTAKAGEIITASEATFWPVTQPQVSGFQVRLPRIWRDREGATTGPR